MRLPSSTGFAVTGVAVAALTLTACSSGPATSGDAADGTVAIVASTNVYGDIASQIGGDLVSVTSLITSAAQDPHSYEASAQDQLALSKAGLVIENGGGYDPFIDSLLSASTNSSVPVVNAAEASGLLEGDDHGDDAEGADEAEHTEDDGHDHIEGFNEHVWYSFHGVEHIAEAIADELSDIDSANAATYSKNLDAFVAKIATLEEQADALQALTVDLGVAITEPVPLYLLEETGLTNKTPDAFSEAIEEGTDVAPTVLQETLALFSGNDVSLLAYNEQTAGPETEQVLTAATNAGIAVVSFTETMPDGADYFSWMTDNLNSIADAVN
ncbi:MAG: transporter substrate-binding protein [Glaciihabitans sp.]|nr:transporter substrate-binding protein [Glaciihabitans sp.]